MQSDVPVCELPGSARFVLWCIRAATLSARGHANAHERLEEVFTLLETSTAVGTVERCARLLLRQSRDSRELGAFGAVFATSTERAVLEALRQLQCGALTGAHRTLAACADEASLPELVACLQVWSAQLRNIGAVLPYVAPGLRRRSPPPHA
jgi:hypothetical protein